MLPNVTITQTDGNTGRKAPSLDGVTGLMLSGVAVGGQFALNDVLGPFFSVEDAEAKGITAAYDSTNTCMAWRHIKDFFVEAGNGRELYVMVVAKTVTLAQQADDTNTSTGAKKMLLALGGRIRLLGLTRIPQVGYAPTYANQLDTDITTAGANAKTLYENEFTAYRPVQIVIEGRDWQGNASSSLNLRDSVAGLNATRVSIFIGQDTTLTTTYTWATKYAAVGMYLGRMARIPVQRSTGRVKDGKFNVVTPGFSNNALIGTLTDTQLNTLNDFGYVYFRNHTGKVGAFVNNDHNACPIQSDYAYTRRSRPADKVSRIARVVYVEEILNDLDVNPDTGFLEPSTCKHFEAEVESEVAIQMIREGELSGIAAYCAVDQNVISTDTVAIEINIVPKGISQQITVTQSYATSLGA